MSLDEASTWALQQSQDVKDLHDIWINVWHRYAKEDRKPPADVAAVKDARKAMHESAALDKTLHDLRSALFELKKFADTPGWVNGVGWNTLKKAKAQGRDFVMSETLAKQVKAIIQMAEPEEDLVE